MQNLKDFLSKYNLQIYILILGILMAGQLVQYTTQTKAINEFINKGARFTVLEGIVLCKRIRALEKANGMEKPIDCDFIEDSAK